MRPSEQSYGDYTLFFNADNVVHRFRISSESVKDSEHWSRVFLIGGRQFTSIVSIVERYTNEEICDGGYRLSRHAHTRSIEHSPSPLSMCTASLLNVLGLIKQQTTAALNHATNGVVVSAAPSVINQSMQPGTALTTVTAPLNDDYLNVAWSETNSIDKSKMSKSVSAPLNPAILKKTSKALCNGTDLTKKKTTNLLVHSKSVVPDLIQKKNNSKHDDDDLIVLRGNLFRYSK